jgi:hypothetical protein
MRYKLTDKVVPVIDPMLPNKPRGIPRVNDRRVLLLTRCSGCRREQLARPIQK